jgi:hypothetical protein
MKDKLPKEIQDRLNAPLPKEAIKPHPTKSYLSTIKAIYVTERFNEVFGSNCWHIKTDMVYHFERTSSKGKPEFTVALKTVFTEDNYGLYHECIDSSTNEDFGDAAKGGTTDAITKIGSYMGVGGDVYKGIKDEPKKSDPKPVEKKAPSPAKELPELLENTPNFEYAKKRLKEGVTLETIKKNFRISKDIEKKLKS